MAGFAYVFDLMPMSRLRKLIQKSRSTVGLQLALALLVPVKGKAAQEAKPKPEKKDGSDSRPESQTAPPHLTGRWDFSRLFDVAAEPEKVSDIEVSSAAVQKVARDAVQLAATAGAFSDNTANADAGDGFVAQPMSHEEISLWLQSFNAGPYATLKYKGEVPYTETRNYVPRVMKAYEQDFNTEYDKHIQKYAIKYGLDPQLVKAIMKTESDFNNDTVSHAGARGLMQVMPIVWTDIQKKYGFDWEYSTDVFEPEKNIEVACAYLAWLRYDFLPRHFAAYDRHPDAPNILVRDVDRGVPDRKTPRIVVGAASSDIEKAPVEVASVTEKEESKVMSDAGSGGKSSKSEKSDDKADTKKTASSKDDKKEAAKADESKPSKDEKAESKSTKPRVEITDSDKVVKKSNSNGKTRVVVRGGNGKSVKISVKDGKVSTSKPETAKASDKDELAKGKRQTADSKKESKESQGG